MIESRMNIMFFLLPKSKVAYVQDDFTLRQTVEKLRYHHYTAIPILDSQGHYLRTVAEGDILYYLKDHDGMDFKMAEDVSISEVTSERDIRPIHSMARMEDLYYLSLGQNFVPVIDDKGVFIGIVTRQAILKYYFASLKG